MSSSASRKERDSRKGKEKRYHSDSYHGQDTPRGAYGSAGGGREGYDHPGESSQNPADQSRYPSQLQEAWSPEATLQREFANLYVNRPGSPNYTTDPPPYPAPTSYETPYSTAASYEAPTQSTRPTSLTYTDSSSASYYSSNQAPEAPATYSATTTRPSTYSDTQATATAYSATYPSAYQTIAPTTHYPQPSLGNAYSYTTGEAETTHPTTYAASPSYAQPPSSPYPTSQDLSTAQFYGQPTSYTQQSSGYTAQDSERHVPKPNTIKQCGCLGCDVDGKPDSRPKLKDGKDEHKKSSSSSRRSESSRSKHSSSKRGESSKSKAMSTSAAFEVHLASANAQNGNMNCGALYLNDIKPWAKPQEPPPGSSKDERKDYEDLLKRWREESKAWRDTSCPCRFGYFNLDGHWVAGNYVRKYLEEGRDALGASPPNPRWENNRWMAPEQPESERKR